MKIDSDNILQSILDSLARTDYIHESDIPNIDLYMDQVTTLMENQLIHTKRHSEDKILTKTMINNYAKNNLLPPPVKKKYSKEHVIVLIFIYYFKNLLSIKDIETLLKPLTDKHFQTDSELSLADIYNQICSMEMEQIAPLQEEIKELYAQSERCFTDAPEDERTQLQLFSFICSLSFDVYMKKMIIETLLDECYEQTEKH